MSISARRAKNTPNTVCLTIGSKTLFYCLMLGNFTFQVGCPTFKVKFNARKHTFLVSFLVIIVKSPLPPAGTI